MCGIAGYVGDKNAPEVLFDMLKRLEYRGYDSAGLAYLADDEINVVKDKGKVDEVRAKIKPEKLSAKIGVAHTRWATHGTPIQINAHPHKDCSGRFVVVHNGIIENYAELKKELEHDGHKFVSDTDTEVIAHLIEEYYKKDNRFFTTFRQILERLEGSYAITALSKDDPQKILVARNDSPLIIGLGEKENYIASDVPAFLQYTNKTIILEDGEFGVVTRDKVEVYAVESGEKLKKIEKTENIVEWDAEEAQKGGFRHFMLKEIMEEPTSAKNALKAKKEVEKIAKKIAEKKRIYFVACGTAYHSGLYGKYILESFGVAAEAIVASEFRYSTIDTINEDCAIIAVSQSGETADTLAAIKSAKKNGAYIASIVNVVGSTITRYSDDVALTHSGPEIAVASTKAYVGQMVCASLLATNIAKEKNRISEKEHKQILKELEKIPEKIEFILKEDKVKDVSGEHANTQTFFFIGRRQNYPTALEGALKIKEIAYVHAEGYPAGELKHGPLALLEEGVVVLAINSQDELEKKMMSNIQEVKSRAATVVSVGQDCDLPTPKTHKLLEPILSIIPLHLFAYYISEAKGLDPDKPRNLAKSVTVE